MPEIYSHDEAPEPASAEERELATRIGMILLTGIRDVENIEKWSGGQGTANIEITITSRSVWAIVLQRKTEQ